MFMKENLFPQNPHFAPLQTNPAAPSQWGVFGAHDPSVAYCDGAYYAFSTGTYGENAYQIRRSQDLIHWQYVGQAFPRGIAASLPAVVKELSAVYGGPPQTDNLWAPDVVPAAGGGWWLYGCYTAEFGNNYSVLFLARADTICGEYKHVADLVVTGGDWGKTPNAIDPQIFFTPQGKMYMTYGSFFGGIRLLELDPATGLRKDGFTRAQYDAGEISGGEYFGRPLLSSSDAEGSVVLRRVVPVCRGDVFGDLSALSWERREQYFLMASVGSLSRDYTMRVWQSDSPDGVFSSPCGERGGKVSGSFSWRHGPEDARIGCDFFVPGHNDLFETPAGDVLIAYHCRTPFPSGKPGERGPSHHLFIGLCAFNARGELVVSPNRYAGERPRAVKKEEIFSCGGNYDCVEFSENPACLYAKPGFQIFPDGTLSFGGRKGIWRLYGENFFSFTLGAETYHGAALPAWIEAEGRGGLTITARSERGLPVFLNQSFSG